MGYKKNTMENIIIYGLGERFRRYVMSPYFQMNIEHFYNIIAISDKNVLSSDALKLLPWKYVKRNDLMSETFDKIVITSDKFFNEISQELIELLQINKNNLLTLDDVLTKIYNKSFHIELFRNKEGIEVGGPSKIFGNTIYDVCKSCDGVNFSDDTVWWKKKSKVYEYKDKKLGEVFIDDAVELKDVVNGKYGFYVSSNNIEHLANPMKAISEAYRVIKKDGYALIIAPMKRTNFDHNRKFTSFDHILNDYHNKVGEDDISDLSDIEKMHDYDMDPLCGGKNKFHDRALNNYNNRCLHHHVFNEKTLAEMFEYFGFSIVDLGELCFDYYCIAKK